jgi:DNA (cytosine-5)-methyltransferase 1
MLKIGTDCSGIEAPLIALDILGIKYEHIFSSDINKHSKKFIMNNFKPVVFYDDIMDRDNKMFENNSLDLYISGFPCQSFSIMGLLNGFKDPRGTIFFECFKFIESNLPKIFILENVKNLVHHDKGETFKVIMEKLNSIKKYNIKYKLLSTQDYDIPQSRTRIYIVGIRNDLTTKCKDFNFPTELPVTKTIDDILENHPSTGLSFREQMMYDYAKNKYKFNDNDKWMLNFNVSGPSWFRMGKCNMCPVLLTSCKYYITSMKRHITANETLLFQGVPYKNYNWSGITDNQKIKFAGNTMSVNILVELLKCLKLVS